MLRDSDVGCDMVSAREQRATLRLADRLALWRRRLPMGAITACAIVAVVHGIVTTLILPVPIARPAVREKVIALTQNSRPRLIIAGDSRADRQLVPLVLAAELGWSGRDVANIGVHTCASTGVRAAYREFAHRFASSPVMVISVSIWSVNDHMPSVLPDDEILWELGIWDRLKLVSTREVLSATFLPEKRLVGLEKRSKRRTDSVPGDRGFEGNDVSAWHNFTPDAIRRQIDWLQRTWYLNPKLDGVRWRQLVEDLEALRDAGVQVVIFDAPTHPALQEAFADSPAGQAQSVFRRRMDALARKLKMPLLRYENDWYPGLQAKEVYFDLEHVNYIGAQLLSRRVGEDLRSLLTQHVLTSPPSTSTRLVDGGVTPSTR